MDNKNVNPSSEESQKSSEQKPIPSGSPITDPNWKWSHLDWSNFEDVTLEMAGKTLISFGRPKRVQEKPIKKDKSKP